MDINKLKKMGIICNTQKKNNIPNDTITIIHNNKFAFLKEKNNYRLQHLETEKYLFTFDNKIELVDFNKENFFMEYSVFNILSDNICCSIFPSHNPSQVLCLANNKLVLKNINLCLSDNNNTIFKLSKLSKPKIIKQINYKPNKNLIKANGLDELFLKKKNFTIITNNIILNKKLIKLTYYQKLPYSLLYLDYIINNYDNLPDYSIFSPKINELDKYIMKLSSNQLITEIDHIITLDGYRYKFYHNNDFTSWQNTGENLDLAGFFKKILKKIPKKKYAEYCSYFFYIVPKKNILQNKKVFYQNLSNKISDKSINTNILDKCWFHIFT